MRLPVSVLGTTPAEATIREIGKMRFFGRQPPLVTTVGYADWTVDGQPLREVVAGPNRRIPDEATPIQNDRAGHELAIATLRTLLGEVVSSAYDSDATRMPDRRVILLRCANCFDVNCRALTAELVSESDIVEWRNIGWQVDYEPFGGDTFGGPLRSLAFDRPQYDALIGELLGGETAA